MVNINAIERQKKEIIKNFKPEEFESYLKSLVSLYYETYLEQDKEKHLAVNTLIEEAVNVYETKYSNVKYNNLVYQVNKANELLTETLIDKHEKEVNLSKHILADRIGNCYGILCSSNFVLEKLVECYSKEPSEDMLATIKEIVDYLDFDLFEYKYYLDNDFKNLKRLEEVNEMFYNLSKFIQEEYLTYTNLLKKINSF